MKNVSDGPEGSDLRSRCRTWPTTERTETDTDALERVGRRGRSDGRVVLSRGRPPHYLHNPKPSRPRDAEKRVRWYKPLGRVSLRAVW